MGGIVGNNENDHNPPHYARTKEMVLRICRCVAAMAGVNVCTPDKRIRGQVGSQLYLAAPRAAANFSNGCSPAGIAARTACNINNARLTG